MYQVTESARLFVFILILVAGLPLLSGAVFFALRADSTDHPADALLYLKELGVKPHTTVPRKLRWLDLKGYPVNDAGLKRCVPWKTSDGWTWKGPGLRTGGWKF